MRKYTTDFEDGTDTQEVAVQLKNVANEIAESNRLKRIELRYGKIGNSINYGLTEKDFEDLA